MLALIAAPLSPTALPMNAFNLPRTDRHDATSLRVIRRILCQLLAAVKLERME